MTSDVDFVILISSPFGEPEWWGFLGPSELIRTRRWGEVVEYRIRLASGLDVELGVGDPSWASTKPVDPGTRTVVMDGVEIVFDPDALLLGLLRATNGTQA